MEYYILTIRWAAASNLIVSIYNTEFDVTSYIEFRLYYISLIFGIGGIDLGSGHLRVWNIN